ncbi:single-stranded DNA-binding protein [Thalassomonas viridans]|uniref:Plasmid-derived single-stranded DNA-binding protein n=1 Tax=Thalassomonas viridans TaxID=137584 RepID=A0AAE9Z1V9_9GAMM|nr:single-stranded DNA-binding protein [Thalassomonas viridans]WDE05043.1 single-stranded DNA-binding protein [Thalassomonas viridans]
MSHATSDNSHANDQQLNSVTLLGNLVNKPEIRYLANPVQAITELTLATHSKWLDKKTNSQKEWTSFHHIKVVGEIVEQVIARAQKGDILLVQGYLASHDYAPKETVNATFIQAFAKGYTQEINQLHCSATLATPLTLVTTENNKTLAHADITISFEAAATSTKKPKQHLITRPVHIWGKQALYLSEQAAPGDTLLIEGKLNYLNDFDKSQFIDAKQIQLIKKQATNY